MSISENSYGSAADVAALVPVRAGSGGGFTPTTRPTLAHVEALIDQISGLVNSMLSAAGFTVPVTASDVVLALAFFVNEEVASIVEGINGSGRFGPTAKVVGSRGRFAVIFDDVKNFIEANKIGFERLGAARPTGLATGIAFKDLDDGGNTVGPIFDRRSFLGIDSFLFGSAAEAND